MAGESILDHFERPRRVGELESPDAEARADNPVCGDEVRAQLRIEDGVIADLRYRALGCHATIAAMSALAERVVGMTAGEAGGITPAEVRAWFEDFPAGKGHAADVAVEVLRRALAGVDR